MSATAESIASAAASSNNSPSITACSGNWGASATCCIPTSSDRHPLQRHRPFVGPEPSVQVDVEGPHPLERGDVFLLCSDGLSGQVNDRVIGAICTALPVEEAVRFLVHMANLQGGPDNTTVIVVRVGGEPKLAGIDSMAEVVFPASSVTEQIVPRFALMMYYLGRLPWAFMLLGVWASCWRSSRLRCSAADDRRRLLSLICLHHGGVGDAGWQDVILMVQNFRETRKASKPMHRRSAPCRSIAKRRARSMPPPMSAWWSRRQRWRRASRRKGTTMAATLQWEYA